MNRPDPSPWLRRLVPLLATAVALLAGVVCFAQPRAASRVWITVLGTTDQHGNLLPVDYYTGKPDARGLAAELRAAYPGASIVGCSTSGEICGTEVLDGYLVTKFITQTGV